MSLDIVWAHLNVPDVSFESGWSREGGGVVGDGAELGVVVVVVDD